MQILLWAAVFCADNETVVTSHFVTWSAMGIAKFHCCLAEVRNVPVR
jgi:hypothetical protein